MVEPLSDAPMSVDADVELGEGPAVRLPAEDLLLVITGRRHLDDVRPTEDIR